MFKNRKILVTFETPWQIHTQHEGAQIINHEDWADERDVCAALKKLGHEVLLFGLHDNVQNLAKFIALHQPDLIFNLCETYKNNHQYESQLVGLLELLGVPYTGANSKLLQIGRDKALQKKILAHHQLKIPYFHEVMSPQEQLNEQGYRYPLIIKPLTLQASEGISQASVVSNWRALQKQVKKVFTEFATPIIIEEYIEGRDIFVGVMQGTNDKIEVFHPIELKYRKYPQGRDKIATYQAKWDDNYRRKWGIGPQGLSTHASHSKKLVKQIKTFCHELFKVFQGSGYVRFDLRITDQGDIYFIEMNPNPGIAKDEEFALSAKHAGISYEAMISKILKAS